uniref:Cytochrome-b5 reductase n=1 Tax=Rhabditophanes sp. KR3021 TaxID=114890 RepID=A0AC35TFJ8_9BILA
MLAAPVPFLYEDDIIDEQMYSDDTYIEEIDTSTGGDRITKTGRNKVNLGPGKSLSDWIVKAGERNGCGKEKDLISEVELAKHDKINDCWIAIHGKVYDVTDYLAYHPGGVPEIVAHAGKDATLAFEEIHGWINYQGFLRNYCMGVYRGARVQSRKLECQDSLDTTNAELSMKILRDKEIRIKKMCDSSVAIISNKWKNLGLNNFTFSVTDGILSVRIKHFHDIPYQFEFPADDTMEFGNFSVICSRNKFTIESKKPLNAQIFDERKWSVSEAVGTRYHRSQIVEKTKVTHDTFKFRLSFPLNSCIRIPVGHHVVLRHLVRNNRVSRAYTPISVTDKEIEFLIKVYDDGLLTPTLGSLEVDNFIEMSDSIGKIDFTEGFENERKVLCLGAGTGLTPMLRLINDRIDKGIDTALLLFNKKFEDIVPDIFLPTTNKHFYFKNILSQETNESVNSKHEYALGKISCSVLEQLADIHSRQIFICGPYNFTSLAQSLLKELNVFPENVHVFDG